MIRCWPDWIGQGFDLIFLKWIDWLFVSVSFCWRVLAQRPEMKHSCRAPRSNQTRSDAISNGRLRQIHIGASYWHKSNFISIDCVPWGGGVGRYAIQYRSLPKCSLQQLTAGRMKNFQESTQSENQIKSNSSTTVSIDRNPSRIWISKAD